MIFDKLCNLERYRGISLELSRVITFLQTEKLADLPYGKTIVDGDRIFINRFSYQTEEADSGLTFEGHEKHLDLHIVLSGQEFMCIAAVETLREKAQFAEEDSIIYDGSGQCMLPMTVGRFALIYPGEGHEPRLALNGSEKVEKAVIKIAL